LKETGELDLNDEMLKLQDITCFNLFKRKLKKMKKNKEWKIDVLRRDDTIQLDFLEKQLTRLRRKEEVPVCKKVSKRLTNTATNPNFNSSQTKEEGSMSQNGRPSTSNPA
jgi:hypothetical protein